VWQNSNWKNTLPKETKDYIVRINQYHEEYLNGN